MNILPADFPLRPLEETSIMPGMAQENPIKELIDTWPTRKALAQAIGANPDAVHKWASSGRIPADWQAAVVIAARNEGMAHITADWMLEQHRREAGAV